MSKVTKIAISLPQDVLDEVEQHRRVSGESRSEIFRRAMELLLRQHREKRISERYIRAYERVPETKEEVEAARRAAGIILSGEPW